MAPHPSQPGARARSPAQWLPTAIAVAVFAGLLALLPAVIVGGEIRWQTEWLGVMGIALSFRVDGLSLLFALLVSGIGAAVFAFARDYLRGAEHQGRFGLYIVGFMFAMLGLVMADDLIALFVFWELTSVTSYLLIGYLYRDPLARRNALQALLITGAGGLFLLAGIVLIGMETGAYAVSEIIAAGGLQDSPLYGPILALVLIGAFSKSALVPLHIWLPNAMAAPTPVSAYLHSATMVKAGIYLLARMSPALSGTPVWEITLVGFGAATALFASLMALRQTDLKTLLAYTTLMALGTLTFLIGLPSPYAATAAVVFLLVHALYKAALFMVVGIIDHETGTRDLTRLSGLARALPLTAAAAALSGLSMAGLVPMLGWIGKELIYAAWFSSPGLYVVAGGAIFLANALMFCAGGIVALAPFWGRRAATPLPRHEAPAPMLAGPLVLGTLALAFGLFPLSIQPLITQAAAALGHGPGQALHVWAGFSPPLFASLATFALGAVLYLRRASLRVALHRLLGRLPDLDRGWDRFLDAFRRYSTLQSGWIQTGHLSRYLAATFLVLLVALVAALLRYLPPLGGAGPAPLSLWLVAALGMFGILAAILTRSRITVLAALGTVGVAVSLIFLLFGASDVAITQLMVETLSVVLLSTALLRLPRLHDGRAPRHKLAHAMLAGGIGVSVSCLILAVTAVPMDRRLTDYFEEFSYIAAHGRNIVNVILVDFRGIDTLGEISVVMIAGLGAVSVLAGLRKGAGR